MVAVPDADFTVYGSALPLSPSFCPSHTPLFTMFCCAGYGRENYRQTTKWLVETICFKLKFPFKTKLMCEKINILVLLV